jgi:hypothetical protein
MKWLGQHSESVKELARILYEKMARLDPSGPEWDEVDPDVAEFCAYCVEEILNSRDLLYRAPADDNVIKGHPELAE